jgi:hypothetical protein
MMIGQRAFCMPLSSLFSFGSSSLTDGLKLMRVCCMYVFIMNMPVVGIMCGRLCVQVGRLKSLEQLDEADAASVFGSFGTMTRSHPPEHNYRTQFGGGGGRRSRRRKQQARSMHTVTAAAASSAASTSAPDLPAVGNAPQVITYSPSHTIVPTYECFNKCTYCNFRTALSGDTSGWADLEQVDRTLQQLAEQGQVSEVLVLAGEIHPARYALPAA